MRALRGTDLGRLCTCTESFPLRTPGAGTTVAFVPWGSAVAASAYWAGPADPSSARGGGTERLPPPHTLLPPAQPSRIPKQRRQRAPAASQLPAAERLAAGATARDLARRRPRLLRAAGKYPADCEQVSLERGWRERTRGVGETERGKM